MLLGVHGLRLEAAGVAQLPGRLVAFQPRVRFCPATGFLYVGKQDQPHRGLASSSTHGSLCSCWAGAVPPSSILQGGLGPLALRSAECPAQSLCPLDCSGHCPLVASRRLHGTDSRLVGFAHVQPRLPRWWVAFGVSTPQCCVSSLTSGGGAGGRSLGFLNH